MYSLGDINSLLTAAMVAAILVFVVVGKVTMRRRKRGQTGRSTGIGNAFLVVEAAKPEVSYVLETKTINAQRRHRRKSVGSDKNK